jgi:hypothetical protein
MGVSVVLLFYAECNNKKDREMCESGDTHHTQHLHARVPRLKDSQGEIHFSMASHKASVHNAFLFERFICVSDIKPNRNLIVNLKQTLIGFVHFKITGQPTPDTSRQVVDNNF